jgi:hypothetical protein
MVRGAIAGLGLWIATSAAIALPTRAEVEAQPWPEATWGWALSCTLSLYDQRVLQGYPDYSFRASDPITRAEFASMLRAAYPDAPLVRDRLATPAKTSYHWGNAAMQWAYQRGFFAGDDLGALHPEQPMTRLQLWAVLANGLDLAPVPSGQAERRLAQAVVDLATLSPVEQRLFATAQNHGLVVVPPGERVVWPRAIASRAEAAAALCRVGLAPGTVPESVLLQ